MHLDSNLGKENNKQVPGGDKFNENSTGWAGMPNGNSGLKDRWRTGKMTQQLKAFAALAKDLGLVPGFYTAAHNLL